MAKPDLMAKYNHQTWGTACCWRITDKACALAVMLACVFATMAPCYADPIDCNPRIAAVMKAARRNGDALALLTLPSLGLLESQDLAIRGHGRKISLLVKPHRNLNMLLAAFNQHHVDGAPLPSVEGLFSFQGTDISGFEKEEIYFKSEGDVVTDILQCGPPGSSPSPGCKHWMIDGIFSVEANYGREWLPKWQEIRSTVTTAFSRCEGP